VVLMDPLAAQLKRLRLASAFSRDDDLVFATSTGRTVGHRNVASRGLTRASTDAGLPGVTFHVLRHTFASILIAQGHDPVFVSRQPTTAASSPCSFLGRPRAASSRDSREDPCRALWRLDHRWAACNGPAPAGVAVTATR
jgi:hypothetical protein